MWSEPQIQTNNCLTDIHTLNYQKAIHCGFSMFLIEMAAFCLTIEFQDFVKKSKKLQVIKTQTIC